MDLFKKILFRGWLCDLSDVLEKNTTKDPITGCWNYLNLNSNGYGVIEINKKQYYTHRLSAMLFHGLNLSSDSFVLHKCKSTACWNPLHIYLGTHIENAQDRKNAGGYSKPNKCKRGHEFTEENTRIQKRYGGIQKSCKTCERMRYRKSVISS